jgi:hypothetical protein
MKLSYVVGGAVAAAVLVAIIVVLVPKTPCNGGVCKVTVTIQDCAGGGITATPDPIPVPSANNIEWTIPNSDDYEFTANGISVHGSGFTNMPGVTGNGKKFIIHDAYSDPTHRIKYAIEVRPSNSTTACKIADPFISHE